MDKEGNSVMMLVFRDTVMMLPCTWNFFGRPPFPLFFRFFGPLLLEKKDVILVLLVNLGTLEEGDMTFRLMIGQKLRRNLEGDSNHIINSYSLVIFMFT